MAVWRSMSSIVTGTVEEWPMRVFPRESPMSMASTPAESAMRAKTAS